MTSNRNPNQIERDIERERSELASTLNELQDRFTPEAVVRQITDELRLHGGDIGRSITQSVKQNPLGLALTAAGVAWLAFGRSYEEETDHRIAGDPLSRRVRHFRRPEDAYSEDMYRDDVDAYTDASVPSSRRLPPPAEPVIRQEEPDWARPRTGLGEVYRPDYYDDLETIDTDDGDDSASFGERVGKVQSRIRDRYERSRKSVGAAAGSASQSVSDTAASAKDGVQSAAHATASSAAAAKDKLHSALQDGYDNIAAGTEKMSEEARARVVAARERAIIASRRARVQAARQSRRASDFFADNPLVVGAIAMAVGAAIGGGLPRTRFEDKHVGSYRDSLFDDAERIYREERGKLDAVAQAVKEEGEHIAQDMRTGADARTPGDKPAEYAVADAVRGAAERLKTAAKQEADRQNLGDTRKDSESTS